MKRAVNKILRFMNQTAVSSLQTAKRVTNFHATLAQRDRRLSARQDLSLDELTHVFIRDLVQNHFKSAAQLFDPQFHRIISKTPLSPANPRQQIFTLYRFLTKTSELDYDLLMQYKLPFSKLGVEQYLVYVKITSPEDDRYLVMWIKRNIHDQRSWRVNDLYIHEERSAFSLGIGGQQVSNQDFYTMRGALLNDSILTALFFTRLFVSSHNPLREPPIFSDSSRCNVEFTKTLRGQIDGLLSSLYKQSETQVLKIVSPQMREAIQKFQASRTDDTSGNKTTSEVASYHICGLYKLPAQSVRQTRVLVHLFVPSVQQYFSIWFTRSVNHGLSWKIEDFYVHQFGKIKSLARADKTYCLERFRTIRTRVFYTPELIGEHVLSMRSAS